MLAEAPGCFAPEAWVRSPVPQLSRNPACPGWRWYQERKHLRNGPFPRSLGPNREAGVPRAPTRRPFLPAPPDLLQGIADLRIRMGSGRPPLQAAAPSVYRARQAAPP